ncbi:alkanesulfonate monooxygenase [Mesorhizobium soli]|uniref:LLM class flavin-dependent oxidoreductase n=1 Tax=Pseudaminobacter soli (ex Li et al. 2025) TaxID=1295366 RepID=UPI00247471EB|nr:LLM class flavin-dependent oxidoreductase [Mesorhizobium soli]MDH6232404.1 alkanesulfonate monooxygenase [Mesorhizobium soli]
MHIEFTSRIERWTPAADAGGRTNADVQAHARRLALAAESAGFDRVLIADPKGRADNSQLASFLLHNTLQLGVAMSHAAGILAPQVAAEQLATLDQLSGGRLMVRMVPGEDGLDHEAALARTDEYLVLLKRLWVNDQPFDHEGPHYSLKSALSAARPFGRAQVPLVLGGLSGTAVKVAAKHADLFELPAATAAETRQTIARVRAAASSHGRADKIRFSVPIRPVIADSRAAAWARANQIAHDNNATRLVGTPEQVALGLLDYCELGISDFVVHGLDEPQELVAFGRDVAAVVRRSLARHEAHAADIPQRDLWEALTFPLRGRI